MASNEPIAVSVIVPARNEEACLGLCLESLATQTGIPLEIVVVDDASTDRTVEIARSFANRAGLASPQPAPPSKVTSRSATGQGGAVCSDNAGSSSISQDDSLANHPAEPTQTDTKREGTASAVPQHAQFENRGFTPRVAVISAPPLPENWTGKNNAMSAGARIAKGKWLLFTDADTFHKPGSLARAVAEAEEHGVALLSYSPEQEVRTFWEKVVMPVIFAELAATYPPAKVRDPNSPIAAANGQYLMISREAYDAVGGHTRIASDLLEDVAMARLVKSSGRSIWFRYGGDAVRTRMYRNWTQVKEGWTKNLALLFPQPAKLGQLRIWQFIVLLLLPPSIMGGAYWKEFVDPTKPHLLRWNSLFLGCIASVFFVWSAISYTIRMRKSHSDWSGVAFGFFGLPLFGYLLLRSHHAYRSGRFDWKDRSYFYSADEVKNMTHGA